MGRYRQAVGDIPAETVCIARAAFPKGTVVLRLREEFSARYRDPDFAAVCSTRGHPALAPWRLALVTVLQFPEHLSGRQAADAGRARIGGKQALGLELADPGFHVSGLAEFRQRPVAGPAEPSAARSHARTGQSPRPRQGAGPSSATFSTPILGAVHDLHLLEPAGATLRAARDDRAAAAPDGLRCLAQPVWSGRSGPRIEGCRLPKSQAQREALALEIGADGFQLLDALAASKAPPAARRPPMVQTLRDVWRMSGACMARATRAGRGRSSMPAMPTPPCWGPAGATTASPAKGRCGPSHGGVRRPSEPMGRATS